MQYGVNRRSLSVFSSKKTAVDDPAPSPDPCPAQRHPSSSRRRFPIQYDLDRSGVHDNRNRRFIPRRDYRFWPHRGTSRRKLIQLG